MNCRHTAGRRAAFAMLWALLVAGVGLRLAVDRSWSALPVPHVRASRRHQLSPNEKYLAWLKQNSHSLACTCFLFSCRSSTRPSEKSERGGGLPALQLVMRQRPKVCVKVASRGGRAPSAGAGASVASRTQLCNLQIGFVFTPACAPVAGEAGAATRYARCPRIPQPRRGEKALSE